MSGYEQTIQEFVQRAVRVLDQASGDMSRLAKQAYRSYDDTRLAQASQDVDDRGERLAQVARQFQKLGERNTRLSRYLASGMEAPPEDDDIWPRIRIIQSQEEERSRLARNLEEGVGQLLANAIFELTSCRHLLGTETQAVDEGLAALQAELEQGLSEVRQLIADLEPPSILVDLGLVAGLRSYLERYQARTGLRSGLSVRTVTERLPTTVEVAIFRIIQEALENVRRHARASRVELSIYQEDGRLVFSVTDDGIGLQSDRAGSHGPSLGLISMHDRAELLQGTLRVRSDVEQGTQLILSIPYPIS